MTYLLQLDDIFQINEQKFYFKVKEKKYCYNYY